MTINRLRTLGIVVAAALAPAGFTQSAVAQTAWALKGTKVYISPDVPPIHDGRVVVDGGKIKAIVGASDKRLLAVTTRSECDGGVIVAGFQNSHVHFTGDEFRDADRQSAESLSSALTRMLIQYGYTTVVDIASDRDNTLALRARIDKGDVRGPSIMMVGFPLFPPQGLPSYIAHLPKELLNRLPQPTSVKDASKTLGENFAAGADATKLFIATPQVGIGTKRMPADIAQAAVNETHRRGKLVFAHPTDIAGVEAAVAAHVDILAHPPLGAPAPWPELLLRQVRDAGMAMVPTLQLLRYELQKEHAPPAMAERVLNESVAQFGRFAAMGGQVLFGTDVGYMTDFDPTAEYELMAQAGMTPMQILASLTTSPAARWQEQDRRGRLAAGMDADIVVLDADPADSPRNFASVRCAVRGGELIYTRR